MTNFHSMKYLLYFLAIGAFSLPAFVYGQCDTSSHLKITIEISTDQFPLESSWTLKDLNGNTLRAGGPFLLRNRTFVDSVCVLKDNCLVFQMNDSAGDGLCCFSGQGGFKVYINGVLKYEGGEFAYTDRRYLGCPQGATCDPAFDVKPGQHIADIKPATWYIFEPVEDGRYIISTCDTTNHCNTAIWIYDRCEGLVWDNSLLGSIFFNDDYCGQLSEIAVPLQSGKTYYIRVGSVDNSCDDQPIAWRLEYGGPATGCTDIFACNYNPIARVDDGSCLYPGDPDCPDGPDLKINASGFKTSLARDEIFNSDQCLIEEGCLKGYQNRTIIRFETTIENIGSKDYYVGEPPTLPQNATIQWEWDNCHNHWHYEGYAEYLLFNAAGEKIPVGFKNGFCVLDFFCNNGKTKTYTCDNQGISAGCGDTYESYLPCQWIDITDVAPGDYTLVTRVNWDQSPDALGNFETDYSNNWAQVCINVFQDSLSGYKGFDVLNNCPEYVDCLGQVLGTAVPDCEGNCNGKRLQGDLNRSDRREIEDVLEYVNESIGDTLGATACNDLNNDQKITVTDACLALECVLHENAPPLPGHGHAPCEFPYNITNPHDSVWLELGNAHPAEGYFDVFIYSPNTALYGFEFSVTGAKIAWVESLAPGYEVELFNDEQEILGLSFSEDLLPKTPDRMPLLRVFTEEFTDNEVCIGDIAAVVNSVLEEVLTFRGDCAEISTGVGSVLNSDMKVQVKPNPANESATIHFENPYGKKLRLEICNAAGAVIETRNDIRSNSVTLALGDWPAGIYFFKIFNEKTIGNGRFVVNHHE